MKKYRIQLSGLDYKKPEYGIWEIKGTTWSKIKSIKFNWKDREAALKEAEEAPLPFLVTLFQESCLDRLRC